jgi:hypothetical protein
VNAGIATRFAMPRRLAGGATGEMDQGSLQFIR